MSLTIARPNEAEAEEDAGFVPFRWTVPAFYKAIEAGLFAHPERLELIRGEIIERVSPQLPPHSSGTMRAVREARRAFGVGFVVRSQMPLDVDKESEPEPDVLVVIGDESDYDRRQPRVEEVRLLIEVSDATLRRDTGSKAALYAEAGVTDYWVLNLQGRCVEVCRDPAPMPDKPLGWGYKSVKRCTEGESIAPLHAPGGTTIGTTIAVSDLLPRPAEEQA